jgi:hypothetical protein
MAMPPRTTRTFALRLRRAGAVLLAIVLVAVPLTAQEPTADEESTPESEENQPIAEGTSEEIVVIGDRLEESIPLELEEYGAEVHVVDRQQILDGGYIDVAGVLQSEVPGLYLAPKHTDRSTTSTLRSRARARRRSCGWSTASASRTASTTPRRRSTPCPRTWSRRSRCSRADRACSTGRRQ